MRDGPGEGMLGPDHMPTDSEPAPAKSTPSTQSAAPRRKKKKKVAPKQVIQQLSEDQIRAPDKQTLVMLGVLSALAIVLWAFAHAGCNYHPPRETRRPRDVKTVELVREPKDAAIEFQQRLLTLNYAGALEIAGGTLAQTVKDQQRDCAPKDPKCVERKKNLEQVITSAVVLERTPFNARVRVTTHKLPGGAKTFLSLVERDSSGWKVTAQVPDGPDAKLPPPSLTPAFDASSPPHGMLMPPPTPASSAAAPAASAAPATSGAKGAAPVPASSK